MTKAQLMRLVGKRVKITFFDGEIKEGILGYTPEFSAKYRWRKPKHFTIGNLDFYVSHIKSCEED